MKRREFLELLPAASIALRSGLAATPGEQPVPSARWIDNGIIDGGGTHETYLFVVRRGGERLDARTELKKRIKAKRRSAG